MNEGKNTCRILKDIRKQIADANGIEYVVEECKYKGNCSGTCPKCEAEVRYLERKLQQRQALGKAVLIAGMSLSTMSVGAFPANNLLAQNDTIAKENVEKEGKFEIKGIVKAESEHYEVPSCMITIKDKNNKVVKHCTSDVWGCFSLKVDSLPQTLWFSYVGMITKKVEVNKENFQNLNVFLEDNPDVIGVVVTKKSKKAKKDKKKSKKKSKKEE